MTVIDIDHIPSIPFKGYDWSVHNNVVKLIDALFDEYKHWYKNGGENRRVRDSDKIKQHLTHFVLEAYRTYQTGPSLLMGVHLGNKYYSEGKGSRYHPSHLSYRIVQNVTAFLSDQKYLELPFGKSGWHANDNLRRTTRYGATPKLITLCNDYGINPFMIGTYPHCEPETIILRKKKRWKQSSGDLVNYADTPFSLQARKNLKKINTYISNNHINLDITDRQHDELGDRLLQRNDKAMDGLIDFSKTSLKRVFNNSSFEQGGRFYGGWWQQIPSDYRIFITINSKKTVQLDFSGMHFAIMYAEAGMTAPINDPYALPGYGGHLRKDIKTAFNIIINCATKAEAIGTIDKRIKDGKLSSELGSGIELIQAFADTHPLIKDKIASGDGIKGQFIDSQVAERILMKGLDINLCILPIHDGFITTAGDEYVLKRLMTEAFEEITGHGATCNPESFELSVLEKKGHDEAHWVTRVDGAVERDEVLEGKAISYSTALHSGATIWDRLISDNYLRGVKNNRESEWRMANGTNK